MGEGVHLLKPSPEKPQQPLSPASPRAIHLRGERGAFFTLGLQERTRPKSNSSAEDQARRPEDHAWIARICANLPPKLARTRLVRAANRRGRVPRTLLHLRQVKVAAHCRAHTRQEAALTEVSNRNRPLPAW